MRRETEADAILQRMLDRHERRKGIRRIIERPSQSFDNPDDLRALTENLQEAAREGAIELVWDRDAPHLVEQVVLVNADRLYEFTGRPHPGTILDEALGLLRGVEVSKGPGRELLQDLGAAWSTGAKLIGYGPGNAGEAVELVRALEAAFADIGADIPMRTRSARLLGDSKALERAAPSLIAYLRYTGIIGAECSRADALHQLGLAKFAQPVLVAGPLIVGGTELAAWPYVGLPPEQVANIEVTTSVRSLLTIENLESFNRHVRTCRSRSDVVVYTGGFPSRSVLALLQILVKSLTGPLHHWGDIDPGGVRIGRHLETSLVVTVTPHLMTEQLASERGRRPEPGQVVPVLPPTCVVQMRCGWSKRWSIPCPSADLRDGRRPR